jgi:hypothetical protein
MVKCWLHKQQHDEVHSHSEWCDTKCTRVQYAPRAAGDLQKNRMQWQLRQAASATSCKQFLHLPARSCNQFLQLPASSPCNFLQAAPATSHKQFLQLPASSSCDVCKQSLHFPASSLCTFPQAVPVTSCKQFL